MPRSSASEARSDSSQSVTGKSKAVVDWDLEEWEGEERRREERRREERRREERREERGA